MYKIEHANINVMDLEKSIEFYKKAFDMKVERMHLPEDGSFKLAFLKAPCGDFVLELTWLREVQEAYDLGSNESHLCFAADDFEKSRLRHKEMECICYENQDMGVYFVVDPDGYWMEVKQAN
jgi:lactoylglutathione lyase